MAIGTPAASGTAVISEGLGDHVLPEVGIRRTQVPDVELAKSYGIDLMFSNKQCNTKA